MATLPVIGGAPCHAVGAAVGASVVHVPVPALSSHTCGKATSLGLFTVAIAFSRCRRFRSASVRAESRCYELRSSDSGVGAFAVEAIAPGQLVTEEAPVLRWSGEEDDLHRCFDELDELQQRKLFQLADAYMQDGEKTLLGIACTNSFQAGEPLSPFEDEDDARVIYLELSRFNHSCVPNCEISWDDREGMLQVYAGCEIAAGQELCIYYQDVRMPTQQRQETLQALMGFTCGCPACAAGDPHSDRRRQRMQRLLTEIDDPESEDSEGFAKVQEIFQLYDEEGLTVIHYRKSAAFKAYAMSTALGNLADAAKWAQMAYEYSLQCHGPFHPQTKVLSRYARRAADVAT